jgi:hypothetical protein
LEVNISWSVNSVDISEGGGAGEGTVGDLGKLLIGVENFLWLSVQTGRVNIRVINTIFLSSSHTELEFKKDANLGEFLKVGLADGNVLLKGLLGEIKHVGGEEGLSSGGEVLLRGGEEAIDPGKPRLLAVIGVENNGDAVELGNLVNVLGTSDGSGNGGLVLTVGERLSSNELSTSLREGDHDGASVLGSGLHTGVDGVGSNNVDSGDGIALGLSGIEKVNESLSSDNSGLDGSRKLGKGLMYEIKKSQFH